MKQCARCGKWKDETEFNWRYQERGVLQSVCRDCQREQGRESYDRHSDSVKERSREIKQRARQEAEYYVYEYLPHSVCANCGEYDFSVLTFDHVRGTKRMDVSRMMAEGYSIQAIEDEIRKCEVVCSNCHMRRENERRSGGRFRRFWPRMPWEK